MVVVGDAAGLILNMGMTVRGLDFAMASGVMAARTILRAREQNDYSSESLATYETLLKESFVWKDLKTFQHMPSFLSNPRLYELYPSVVCDLFEQIMWVGEQPKERFSKTIFHSLRQKLFQIDTLRDLLMMRKI